MSLAILAADKHDATLLGDCIVDGKATPEHPKVFRGPGGTLFGESGHVQGMTNFGCFCAVAQQVGFSEQMTWAEGGEILDRWAEIIGPHLYSHNDNKPVMMETVLCGRCPNGRIWIRHNVYEYGWAGCLVPRTADFDFPETLTLFAIGQTKVFKEEMSREKGWYMRTPVSPDGVRSAHELQRPFFFCDPKVKQFVGWAMAARIATLSVQRGLPVAAPFHTVML